MLVVGMTTGVVGVDVSNDVVADVVLEALLLVKAAAVVTYTVVATVVAMVLALDICELVRGNNVVEVKLLSAVLAAVAIVEVNGLLEVAPVALPAIVEVGTIVTGEVVLPPPLRPDVDPNMPGVVVVLFAPVFAKL